MNGEHSLAKNRPDLEQDERQLRNRTFVFAVYTLRLDRAFFVKDFAVSISEAYSECPRWELSHASAFSVSTPQTKPD